MQQPVKHNSNQQLNTETASKNTRSSPLLKLASTIGNQTMQNVIQRDVTIIDFPDPEEQITVTSKDSLPWEEMSNDWGHYDSDGLSLVADEIEFKLHSAGNGFVISDILKLMDEVYSIVFIKEVTVNNINTLPESLADVIWSDCTYLEKVFWATSKYVKHPLYEALKNSKGGLINKMQKLVMSKSKYEFPSFQELQKFCYIKNYEKQSMEKDSNDSNLAAYQVDVINVGQGTSVLVSNRAAANYGLVDLGSNVKNAPEFLSNKNSHKIRAINDRDRTEKGVPHDKVVTIITHNHADHNGGDEIPSLKSQLVGEIGKKGYMAITDAEQILLNGGGLKAALVQGTQKTYDKNDNSLITYLDTPKAVIVLPGDRRVEDILQASFPNDLFNQKAVILVASHHGSRTGTNAELLHYFANKKASSIHIIISAGINNIFEHPSAKELLVPGGEKGIPPSQGAILTLTNSENPNLFMEYNVYSTQNLKNYQGSVSVKADDKNFSIYTKKREGKIDTSSTRTASLPPPFYNMAPINQFDSLNVFIETYGNNLNKVELCMCCYYFSKAGGKMPLLGSKVETFLKENIADLDALKKAIVDFYNNLGEKIEQQEVTQEFINEIAIESIRKLSFITDPPSDSRFAMYTSLFNKKTEDRHSSRVKKPVNRDFY